MDNTIVVVEIECASTKQGPKYDNGQGGKSRQHDIEFNIPYNNNNIFYQLSGGTVLKLMTVSDEAVANIEAGKRYRMTIQEIV